MNKIKNSYKCIKCGKKINTLLENSDKSSLTKNPINHCWDGGMVSQFSMGYGSCLDDNIFNFAICDKCIIELVKNDTIQFVGTYQFPNETEFIYPDLD